MVWIRSRWVLMGWLVKRKTKLNLVPQRVVITILPEILGKSLASLYLTDLNIEIRRKGGLENKTWQVVHIDIEVVQVGAKTSREEELIRVRVVY